MSKGQQKHELHTKLDQKLNIILDQKLNIINKVQILKLVYNPEKCAVVAKIKLITPPPKKKIKTPS